MNSCNWMCTIVTLIQNNYFREPTSNLDKEIIRAFEQKSDPSQPKSIVQVVPSALLQKVRHMIFEQLVL